MTSEEAALRYAWDRHPAEHLDSYLVSSVQDPRINAQSIFTRALLIDSLFPNRFTREIEAEFRFGLVLTWALRQLESGRDRYQLLEEISQPQNAAVPGLVQETYSWLQSAECPLIDYLTTALDYNDFGGSGNLLNPVASNTFMAFWRDALTEARGGKPAVLEVACGSANDYRFLHASGIASLLDYTGLDISVKNIANARRRHPDIAFLEGSILSSGLQDRSYDYVFAHDLFEHLSASAIDRAVGEICRITRREVWLHFFRAKAEAPHEIVRLEPYYQNTISMEALKGALQLHGFDAEALFICPWQLSKFRFSDNYNPRAASVAATRRAGT